MAEFPFPSKDPLVMCQLSAVLNEFWLKLSPLLEQVQKGLASEKLVKDLEQVTFSHPDMLTWLTNSVANVSKSLSEACEKELATAWDAALQLQSLLAKLPDPACKEEEYRCEGSKVTKQVADLIAKIGHNEKVRLKGVAAVKRLSDMRLPGNTGENGVSALFQKYEGGEACFTEKVLKSAACGSVHVAMVAALCLLRNASLGAGNDEGKLIRKQLQGVAEALKQKVEALKLCEKPDAKLLDNAQSVLEEAFAQQKHSDAGAANSQPSAAHKGKDSQEKDQNLSEENETKEKKQTKKDKTSREKKDKTGKEKKDKTSKEKKEKKKDAKDKGKEPKSKKAKKSNMSEGGAEDQAEEDAEPPSKKRKHETPAAKGKGRGRGRGRS